MAKQSTVTSEQAKAAKQVTEAAPVDVKLCECGQCGLEVKPGRRFRQGHDARRKSMLIEYLEEGQGAMAEELVERGWMTQAEWDERIGRRINERAAKDAKAKARAEKAAEREAEKQARAEAKAAKATAATEGEAA
jgi:hypothetical protein